MELTDKRIQGRYIGILLGPAAQGASLKHCRVEMSIDENGISLPFTETADDEPRFAVRFPPSWIFHMQGWGFEKDLSVRQRLGTDLAQVIIGHVPWHRRVYGRMLAGFHVDMTVILGEGMPMPLMMFMHEKRGEKALQRMYNKIAKADSDTYYGGNAWWRDSLTAVENPMQIVENGTSDDKRALAVSISHNLWTATAEPLAERVAVLEALLKDSDPMVRHSVMSEVTMGARAAQMVPAVVAQLHELTYANLRQPDWGILAKQTVDAGICLLYEMHGHLQPQLNIVRRFGSLDVESIHAQCEGVIEASDQKLMEDFFRGRDAVESRVWTYEMYQQLRGAVMELVHKPDFFRGREMDALDEYYLPPETSLLLKGQRLHS